MPQPAPSLRRQLALALAGCLTALCLAANLAYYHYIRQLSIEEFDLALQNDLEMIMEMTSVHDGGNRIDLHIHNHDHPEFRQHDEAKFYHISHADGRCHLRSPSLNEQALPIIADVHGALIIRDLTLPDGRSGRVITTLSQLEEVGDGSVTHSLHFALAVSRDGLDRILTMQRWCAIALGALLIGASVVIALLLTKRSFRKVDDFASHLSKIDFDALGSRLPENGLPIELSPLAKRFNEALERLDQGARREIRFNANVAHELRTPVAELRAIADVGLQESSGGKLENPEGYFEDATELAHRMARLIDTISSLNRTGLGRCKAELASVDLVDMVQRAWRVHEGKASTRKLQVDIQLPDQCLVATDPPLAMATINNIFTNAVSHTPTGGTIRVTLSDRQISVENTNDSLKESDLPNLIEPFWQKDSSRSDSSHFGIGMALVDAYTRLLGIDLELSLPSPESFSISLTFPAESSERSLSESPVITPS